MENIIYKLELKNDTSVLVERNSEFLKIFCVYGKKIDWYWLRNYMNLHSDGKILNN